MNSNTPNYGDLMDSDTAEVIRPATAAEREASLAAGDTGRIEVDGQTCYVDLSGADTFADELMAVAVDGEAGAYTLAFREDGSEFNGRFVAGPGPFEGGEAAAGAGGVFDAEDLFRFGVALDLTLNIADPASRDGGGTRDYRGTIRDAQEAWREWALGGEYTSADGSRQNVFGSIYCGEYPICDSLCVAVNTLRAE